MNNGVKVAVTRHPFFLGMDPKHLEIVGECATEAILDQDQILFKEGEPANQFYLIQSGQIALEAHEPANGTVFIQNVGPDEVLGWSWLFPPFVWHFRARVLEPTKVIVLNGAHLLAAAESDHDFGYNLMKRIVQVLMHRLQTTRHKLLTQEFETALKEVELHKEAHP